MGRLVKGTGRVVPAAVLTAREEAARIRAEAAADAETLARQEERRGYEEGFRAGREAGLASVTELLVAARAEADEVRARTAQSAATLARRMAEKIVGRALDLSPQLMSDIVGQALAASRARRGPVVVRLHPEDLAAVEAGRPQWLERVPAADVRLSADPAVGRHGCVVETPAGRLDARLEPQLAALAQALERVGGSSR